MGSLLKKEFRGRGFFRFAKDYRRIYKLTRSLTVEVKTGFLERFQFLETEFEEIKEFKRLTSEEYKNDKVKRGNIKRWTENILNATIDIAKIILASKKKMMPKTYEEVLFDFGNFIGLNEERVKELSELSELRNILACEYLNLIYKQIQDFIKESPKI